MDACIEAFGAQRSMFERSGGQGDVQLSGFVEWLQVPLVRQPTKAARCSMTPQRDSTESRPDQTEDNMTKITRRAVLGAIAAAPLARPALLRAQGSSAPVKIGLLSDVAGPIAMSADLAAG
jgi:hypothetical protein